MKIIIRPAEQEIFIIKRSWRERIFTRPFQPFRKTKTYVNEANVERNKFAYVFGDTILVTAQQRAALEVELAKNK